MNLNTYASETDKTAIYPEAGTGSDLELAYLTLGLTGEAGEVAEKVKKMFRDQTLDVGALAYELGDVFWYLTRLCKAIGYEPEDVLQINNAKLMKRLENNTIRGNGDAR